MNRAAHLTERLPLRWLRAVSAVAQTGSATRAAEPLFRSVSAVSRSLRQAEQRLGLPLFERGARGMACTPAGRVLALRTHRALAHLIAAHAEIEKRWGAAGSGSRPSALERTVTDAMMLSLVAVSGSSGESAAAAQLGLSQSAIHQNLQALQRMVATPLFRRSAQGTRLTEAGDCLVRHVKLALGELRIAHEEVATFLGQPRGELVVGALPMASTALVPQALSRLLRTQPGVLATVVDGTYETLLRLLRQGDVDLMVGPLRGEQSPGDMVEHELFVDSLVAVVRRGHPCALADRRLQLGALRTATWVAPLPGTPARRAFDGVFAAVGWLPRVCLQANSPSVVRAMLLMGDVVALLSPQQIKTDVDSGLLEVLPLVLRGTERRIGITLRRDGLPSLACQGLQAALQAVGRSWTGIETTGVPDR